MDLQIIAEFGEEFKVDAAKRMQELDAWERGIDSGEYDSMRKLIEYNCRQSDEALSKLFPEFYWQYPHAKRNLRGRLFCFG